MSIDVCDASGFTCAMRIGEIGYRPDPIWRVQTVRAGRRYCIMQTAERLVPFFRKFEFLETGI